MTRSESNSRIDTPAWSAHNLPKPKTSPMLGFSVLAVAAGLIAIVLASAASGPIRTSGTKMEPSRFTAPMQQAVKADAESDGIVIASGTN